MEDDPKESCHATNPKERLRLIKEERRKQHEQRLERTSLFPAGLGEESDTIKRFSKYRRSGSDRASRKVDQPLSSRQAGDEGVADCSSKTETVPEPDLSREHLWNVSPAYIPGVATERSSGAAVRSNETVANSLSSWGGPSVEAPLSSDFTGSSPSPVLSASLSLDQSKRVLKKPCIPNILRSATEPAPAFSGDDDVIAVKKPSILKKKDDSSSSATPSSSANGQSASVSFGLPVTTSVLSRTKSIDSNLSGDTETGYWSGGESVGGILKSRRFPSEIDQGDQSSIMKSRRSSFGSSVASNSGSSEGGLQSILKRKLSYDSSYIMKEANLNEYSFSTHSLPACGCMSPEPKPILKKKSNSEDLDEVEPKPILKHRSSRDCPEVTPESEKTIKPCLKKSSSKSVDETLSGSASVNFSPSFPPSVSPVSAVSDGPSPSSKGILKRGGILKNAWRESASTSTSSSSSELDNSRAFQSVENEGDELSSPFLHQVNLRDSSQVLVRAQRFYRSEGDINADERSSADSQMMNSDPVPNVNDTVPLSFPSMFFNRCDDPAVENGQACSNNSLEQQQQKQLYDHQLSSLNLSEEKNPRRTHSSGVNTHRSSSYSSASASAAPSSSLFPSFQATVDDNSENVAPEGYSSLLTPGKNKFSGSTSLKAVSPTLPGKLCELQGSEEERVVVGVPESKYKLSSRRTSLRSSNPASSEETEQVNIPQLLNDSPFDTFTSLGKTSFEHGNNIAEKTWIPPSLRSAGGYRSKSVSEEYSSAIHNTNYYLDDCHHEGETRKAANSVSTKTPSSCSRNNASRGLVTCSVLDKSDSNDPSEVNDDIRDATAHLSVAEKRSLFMQLENERRKKEDLLRHKQVEEVETSCNSSFLLRPKRHTTQPVTTNELAKATKFIVQNNVQDTLAASTNNAPSTYFFSSAQPKDNTLTEEATTASSEIESVQSGLADLVTLLEQSDISKDAVTSQGYSHIQNQFQRSSQPSMDQDSIVMDENSYHGSNAAVEDDSTGEKSISPVVTSKPPSGAGLSKSRHAADEGSFVARLARIHNERARTASEEIRSLPCTLPRMSQQRHNVHKDTLSRVSPAVVAPSMVKTPGQSSARTCATPFMKEHDDELLGEPKSLKDRIRMFDSLASTIQSEYKAVKKKTVTSKRFLTQPVAIPSAGFRHRFVDKYEIGAMPSLPTSVASSQHHREDAASEQDHVRDLSSGGSRSSVEMDDHCTNSHHTVKSEQGQIEDELECSQSLGATIVSKNVHHLHSSQEEEKDKSSDSSSAEGKEIPEVSSSTARNRSREQRDEVEEEEEEEAEDEMPERILSDESANSSNDEALYDAFSDPSDSCVKRRSKSSANSMMMSPESEVNLFGKGTKVNRNSIADKIAALQTNGEISWKKRVMKINPEFKDKEKPAPTDQNDNVQLRKNNRDSSVIANRLSQLESSQEKWKNRVGENDANIFTVQGRLERAGKISKGSTSSAEGPGSPPKESKVKSLGAKVIAPIRFRTKETSTTGGGSSSNANSPKEELPKQSVTVAEPIKRSSIKNQYSRSDTNSSTETNSEEDKVVVRSVVENDNETFSKFFSPISDTVKVGRLSTTKASTTSVKIDESSFQAIQSEAGRLVGIRKNVKAPRKHTSTKNPVKSLASRLQNQTYTELSPQVREKEMKKRLQIDNLTKNAPLSVEALAGLASKEDFTAVKLKKAGNAVRAKDFPHPMLIRIKGKRQVQTRVVAPEVTSLSSGDNYILLTSNKLYQFIGEYSNRLERAKIADVVSHIVQKKDLGCRISSMTQVGTLEEPLIGGRDQSEFFEILGGETVPDSTDDLGDESDEAYESGIVSTNRVYEVDDAEGALVPLLESGSGWGSQPKFSLLEDDKVLVFDFVTEVYVWSGSKADPELKKTAYRLAKEMFEGEYEEPECADKLSSKLFDGPMRPNWCFLKKINQHMEPILFIEKFFDWPDDSGRLIKVQQLKKNSDGSLKEGSYNFTACDVQEMMNAWSEIGDPELELEGFDVGRGTEVHNAEIRRTSQINTVDVQAWNISEFSKCDVETSALGQFYSEETYVIRWQFSVSQIGRDLKGNISKHSGTMGRERFTYFFWQGKNSRITEQGTSALMTVELDREKGPQVRVEEGREPPAFLNLFQGLMFVHLESREAAVRDTKLYVAMGALETEGHFVEVNCHASAFRSLGSFILVDCVKGRVYLWHGKLSNSTTRKIASKGAAAIIQSPQRYINVHGAFRLLEFEEGGENALFFSCLGVPNAKKFMTEYYPIRDGSSDQYSDTKAFVFSSIQGSFESAPVVSVKRKIGSPESFPILQEELYSAQQPRLFLISRGSDTWLWQGWCPLGDEENENTATGSGEIRWAAERKAALQTAVAFCEETGTNGHLILAGLEPACFTNLFPYWSVNEEAREANLSEGKTVGLIIPVEDELQKFMRPRIYTLEELQERPEGVDQSRLETYLCDEEFESLLKMDRDEFNKLQAWKQNELKKAVGLF